MRLKQRMSIRIILYPKSLISLKYRNPSIMKFFYFFTVLIVFSNLSVSGQNLIGYREKEIRQYMRDKEKNMDFQKFTNNSTFKYLKYVDKDESQTLLFFLTGDSVCKSIRLVCDKSLKNQKTKEFDNIYKKDGEDVWTEIKEGKKYIIELKDDDYSLSITFRPGI
jgi:hypothetical protein